MIKVSQTVKPVVRQCTAPFNYTDPESGELKTVDIRVDYRSRSTKEIKEQAAEFEARRQANPEEIIYLSETLANRLVSLPDLLDENNQPVAITVEFLDSLAVENLQAIDKAIEEDRAPKSK